MKKSTSFLKRLATLALGLAMMAMAFSPLKVSAHFPTDGTKVQHSSGVVERVAPDSWSISGQTFLVNDSTLVDSSLQLGDRARVEFVALADGQAQATKIENKASGYIVNVRVLPDGSLSAAPVDPTSAELLPPDSVGTARTEPDEDERGNGKGKGKN